LHCSIWFSASKKKNPETGLMRKERARCSCQLSTLKKSH
jgi:hypothetical protein